jgi:hypothetical protein
MSLRSLPVLALLLLGCPADPIDRIPEDTDDTDTDDTTDTVPALIPDGERIMIHHGSGSPEPDESGWAQFEFVDHHWKDTYGWNTDYRDAFNDDLSDYRAIFFIAPGYTAEVSFEPGLLENLRGALAVGTRIIVLTEVDGCASFSPNELLGALGSTMRLTGDGLGLYQTVETDQIAPHQITEGVDLLKFRDACYVDIGEGEYLARNSDDLLIGVERIGEGGEVVLIGDFEFMDDSGPREWARNGVLADRLVEIDPGLAAR